MDSSVAGAAAAIRAGGIVAYPTEGVWGLGCDPANREAVERLIALKGRDVAKGLILIAAEETQLTPWIKPFNPALANRVRGTWPGPVTWVVPARADCPAWLTGGRPTIAVRITAHPPARALCVAAGTALVSTSANPSGEPPLSGPEALREAFGPDLAAILAGPLGGLRGPTEMRDLQTGRILRPEPARGTSE
jgi:L-threonylcarbamoyladenylate synthase